jgi:hypothetical protein
MPGLSAHVASGNTRSEVMMQFYPVAFELITETSTNLPPDARGDGENKGGNV